MTTPTEGELEQVFDTIVDIARDPFLWSSGQTQAIMKMRAGDVAGAVVPVKMKPGMHPPYWVVDGYWPCLDVLAGIWCEVEEGDLSEATVIVWGNEGPLFETPLSKGYTPLLLGGSLMTFQPQVNYTFEIKGLPDRAKVQVLSGLISDETIRRALGTKTAITPDGQWATFNNRVYRGLSRLSTPDLHKYPLIRLPIVTRWK